MIDLEDLKKYDLIYLATPYSAYEWGIEFAWKDASALAGALLKKGLNIYSPVAHTHPIAIYGNINPLDHETWMRFDAAMVKKSDVLLVAKMRGWGESKGIAIEIEAFQKMNKPIYMLDQWSLEAQLLVA